MQDFNNPLFICLPAKDFLEKSSAGAKEIYFSPEVLDVNTEGESMDYNYFANFTYSVISILAIKIGFSIK